MSGVPVGNEPWPGVLLLLLIVRCACWRRALARVVLLLRLIVRCSTIARCVIAVSGELLMLLPCQVCLLETSRGQVCYCRVRCVTAVIAVSGVPVGDEPWPGVGRFSRQRRLRRWQPWRHRVHGYFICTHWQGGCHDDHRWQQVPAEPKSLSVLRHFRYCLKCRRRCCYLAKRHNTRSSVVGRSVARSDNK